MSKPDIKTCCHEWVHHLTYIDINLPEVTYVSIHECTKCGAHVRNNLPVRGTGEKVNIDLESTS